jgi:3-dehydroquinate synthase
MTGYVQVDVALGDRGYPIYIGAGVIEHGGLLAQHIRGEQVAVFSNETVAPLYLDRLLKALGQGDKSYRIDVFTMPDGEEHKNLDSYAAAMDFLLQRRHSRSTTLIALGGGVVGDLTGFVAATFQRGVDFIQVPTTLLAQVDSSVGGKTAVNHPRGKNMIGAFHQPRCVLADTSFFDTLPQREYRAGLAEVVKYGVIVDADFFRWLEENVEACVERQPEAVTYAVRRSCELKAAVVAADERESGMRAVLNFGHTFGHAIETLTGYKRYLHGEAVAIGMIMAADLSARQGPMSWKEALEIRRLVASFGLPEAPPPLVASELIHAMGADKKVVNGRLRLVLAEAIGRVRVTEEVDMSALRETLMAGERLCYG